jgi:hypothetical protein
MGLSRGLFSEVEKSLSLERSNKINTDNCTIKVFAVERVTRTKQVELHVSFLESLIK